MDESVPYLALTDTPALRRCWLLHKALECAQLDRAIEIARSADAFITGVPAELSVTNEPLQPVVRAASTGVERGPSVSGEIGNRQPQAESPPTELCGTPTGETTQKDGPSAPAEISRPTLNQAGAETRRPISPEQRQALMARIAQGASNAELASEYGLAPRQVQGIRMLAARSKVRNARVATETPDRASTNGPGLDDVVRYLRQQDDVVVPQAPGEFLLNGRFRMNATELVGRANRMRSRQGKPPFPLNGHASRLPEPIRSTTHPMFRNGSATEAVSELS
jgi:hypothetical protein